MTDWKEEHSSKRPDSLEVIAPGIYMQRQNIREVTVEATEQMEAYTEYVCECRKMTFDEYKNLQNESLSKTVAQVLLGQAQDKVTQTSQSKVLSQILLAQAQAATK